MCLFRDKKLTEQKLNYFKQNKIKEIIVWKILRQHRGRERYDSSHYCMEYKIGKNIPIKMFKKLIWSDGSVGRGVLHAFTSRIETRKYQRLWALERVIRCRVKVKDIIAYGDNNDIAVKALYIDKFSEKK